ncbi:MAG: succinate dehydrogenase [Pseudomonadota bacterium]
MMEPSRVSRMAAAMHRLSGLALVLFLPLHFLALGLALEGAATLDAMLAFADLPLVKIAEWGLVTLLTVHLTLGLRLLVLELIPWPEKGGLRLPYIWAGLSASALAALIFLAGAF